MKSKIADQNFELRLHKNLWNSFQVVCAKKEQSTQRIKATTWALKYHVQLVNASFSSSQEKEKKKLECAFVIFLLHVIIETKIDDRKHEEYSVRIALSCTPKHNASPISHRFCCRMQNPFYPSFYQSNLIFSLSKWVDTKCLNRTLYFTTIDFSKYSCFSSVFFHFQCVFINNLIFFSPF